MQNKYNVLQEAAKIGALEEASISEQALYINKPLIDIPHNFVKYENKLYKVPEEISADDLLSMLVYTNAKIEQHLRFIKGTIIAGIIIAIVSAFINLFI